MSEIAVTKESSPEGDHEFGNREIVSENSEQPKNGENVFEKKEKVEESPNALKSTISVSNLDDGKNSASGSKMCGGALRQKKVMPINSLTPYQNNWTIRARVGNKGLKHYKNARKEGDILTMDLADETGAIRTTCWNEVAKQLDGQFEENAVYYITRGTLKPANRAFSSIKNDYELTLNADSVIEPCEDELQHKVPTLNFNFVKIDQIANRMVGTLLDVIGVVKSCSPLAAVVSKKTGAELKKREIVLVDGSNTSVNLTLWNKLAEEFGDADHHVLAVRGARIQEFMSALSLSALQQSQVLMDPDLPEAVVLKDWQDGGGLDAPITNISTRVAGAADGGGGSAIGLILLGYVSADKLGAEKATFYNAKGTVMHIKKDTALYRACSQPGCNKKVLETEPPYRCQKCVKEMDTFSWRLMLKVLICDFTGDQWITCFQEPAEKLLGVTASALGSMRDEKPEEAEAVFRNALFKDHLFRLRSKTETYNDESRLFTVCVGVEEVDCTAWEEFLEKEISQAEAY